MYIYVYISIYVIYIYIYIYIHIHIHIPYKHTYTHVRTYTCTHAHTRAHTGAAADIWRRAAVGGDARVCAGGVCARCAGVWLDRDGRLRHRAGDIYIDHTHTHMYYYIYNTHTHTHRRCSRMRGGQRTTAAVAWGRSSLPQRSSSYR